MRAVNLSMATTGDNPVTHSPSGPFDHGRRWDDCKPMPTIQIGFRSNQLQEKEPRPCCQSGWTNTRGRVAWHCAGFYRPNYHADYNNCVWGARFHEYRVTGHKQPTGARNWKNESTEKKLETKQKDLPYYQPYQDYQVCCSFRRTMLSKRVWGSRKRARIALILPK